MNFYPFHIGDYISHTSHLSNEEDLAYRRLIDLYYQTEIPFRKNLGYLARRIKSTEEIVAMILVEFFEECEEGWRNKRADEEIAKYHAMQEGGRLGAEKRWGKVRNKGSDSPPKHPPMQTKNQEPRTINHINTPEGVSDSLFKDYLEVRKAKKAKWTETALKGLQREASKANMTLEQVMQMCCERGWASFKAEWAESAKASKELPLATPEQIEHAYKVECGADPSKARFNSYNDMRKFIQDFRDKSKRALQ
jgi:uncharacterized protein YdaU (DUF1376 family)